MIVVGLSRLLWSLRLQYLRLSKVSTSFFAFLSRRPGLSQKETVYRLYVRTLNLYFRCFAGFSGANCSIASCLSVNNCSGHGLCVEAGLCKCDVGYTGSDCANASCEAVNYCSG